MEILVLVSLYLIAGIFIGINFIIEGGKSPLQKLMILLSQMAFWSVFAICELLNKKRKIH